MSSQSQRGVKNRRKLKNLVLIPEYQFPYVLLVASVGLFLAFCNGAVFYSYTRENYSILVDLAPMTTEVKAQLHRELWEVVCYLALFSVGFVALVSALALYFSHRTAGPVSKMKRVFEDVAKGKTDTRIHLRPRDYFQDVAESFNKMMDSLESEHSSAGGSKKKSSSE